MDYAGFEKGQLQSVLKVEHCLEPQKTLGGYNWSRYEDGDADGRVDTVCINAGLSYVGGKL